MTIIRSAAETLVADLNRAEQSSHGWQDDAFAQTLVDTALDRCLATLASTGLWGRDNQLPSSEFWQIAGPILERGSLHCRARFKPRGYAGDYETFVMFWEKSVCDDPLGRLFDHYFQRQTAVEAVRARTEAVAAAIVEHVLRGGRRPYSIASIGSGPVIDIEQAVMRLSEPRRKDLAIQLFDLDEAALEHAGRRLQPWLNQHQCTIRRENLYRLAERRNATELLAPADFIFCTGLFDYLPDESAIRLLRLMWQQLKPGGILIVGNFAPHNPTRAYMEWFGNWYLLYRTPEQFAELAIAAKISHEQFRVTADRTGVELLLVASR
jgi:extracellular factor (EF) 3-hydroxypalmitic acid methyl ester biosynthesis protein